MGTTGHIVKNVCQWYAALFPIHFSTCLIAQFITKLLDASYYTWKLYLFLVHQYQPVSSFLLTAVILVYPYFNSSTACAQVTKISTHW